MSSSLSTLLSEILSEHAALAGGAVLFEGDERSQIELTGRDRASFLHNFCTNDIKGLRPGAGCEAFLTNIKGRILEHLFVFADADALWLTGTAGREAFVVQHLDRYLITEDVQIHPRTNELSVLLLAGAGAARLLRDEFATAVDHLANLHHTHATLPGDVSVNVRRQDLGTTPVWSLSLPRPHAEAVAARLRNAGAVRGRPELWNALRIEAGLPVFGVDLTDDHLAQEARRTPQAISFTKGCYLGQEPIARIDAIGHVNRELCVIECDAGDSFPSLPSTVSDAGGSPIGAATSVTWHPATQSAWCLGVLRTSVSAEGSRVFVGEARLPGIVRAPLMQDAKR